MQLRFDPLYAFFLFLLLFSCQSDQKVDDHRTVFHYNQHKNITSLDPAFARAQNNIWAIDHLYNGLVQLDDSLNVQPAIAASWKVSEDGLTYIFALRNDVYFHQNQCFKSNESRVVTARDVKYSFNRLLDEKVNSPGSWVFKGKVAEQDPFLAPAADTFIIKLAKPFRPFLGMLSMQYCSVVPKEAVEYYGRDFRSNPVGTGPFKFKRWIENQSLFLSKNEKYFEAGLPKIDAIRISFMGDRKTAYLELSRENIDFFSGLESSYINELITKDGSIHPAKANKIQFIKSPYLNSEYLGINLSFGENENPLKTKKIRQALNYGIDRALMLQTLRNNVGVPANSGFTPLGLPSFDAKAAPGYSYDSDKARTLLREAGFPNGEGLPTIILHTTADYEDLCTFAAKQWENLGLKIKIELAESATLRQMMTKGQVAFFRASWIMDYPDAESFFTVFYSKNPAPPNYTRFKNPEFDRLYEAALKENDDAIRYELYQQMDRLLIEEAPVVFLFYDQTALFAAKSVRGLSRNAINLLKTKKIYKEK